MMPDDDRFQETLARLHLLAVLPALEELVRHSPAAGEVARQWNFSLRMRLRGGPAVTLHPTAGALQVSGDGLDGAALTLSFLSARQLNRTFVHQSALPPIPSGRIWHLAAIKHFTKLSVLLDQALQPTPEALRDSTFLHLHLRLLFKVLIGALPVIAERDETTVHALHGTPPGLAQIVMDGLGLRGWARWDSERLTSGAGDVPSAPDTMIIFRDAAAATEALRSQLDATAAVGLGKIQIRGLVPLADGLSVAMDRVETYLQPAA